MIRDIIVIHPTSFFNDLQPHVHDASAAADARAKTIALFGCELQAR
jgi:hypothetical protein